VKELFEPQVLPINKFPKIFLSIYRAFIHPEAYYPTEIFVAYVQISFAPENEEGLSTCLLLWSPPAGKSEALGHAHQTNSLELCRAVAQGPSKSYARDSVKVEAFQRRKLSEGRANG
jgi:hypothetical protein